MRRQKLALIGASFLMVSASSAAYAVSDEDFLKSAIEINLAEIAAGNMAKQKGNSDAVKSYGDALVADHTAANEEATALADTMKVTVPTTPPADAEEMAKKMAEMNGEEFDLQFASHMVSGHEKAIALFEDKADDEASDVTAFAKKTLPVLQKHLETAESISGTAPTSGDAPMAVPAPSAPGTGDVPMGEPAPPAPTPGSTSAPDAVPPGTPDTASTPDATAPATTETANTPEPGAPFEGANSFTEAQAQQRAVDAGFTGVSGLTKDEKGIWRGTAQSKGAEVSIAIDYQGNVVAGSK